MATQTGSIDLTASNSVKLAAEAGWQSDLEDYATKAELDVQADRIGMVVANNDASSSLQLTADAMTYIGNNVTIKGTDGTSTVISGGQIQTGSLSIGAFDSAAQSATLNSNISVGGRNLLKSSDAFHTPTAYKAYDLYLSEPIEDGVPYIIQLWDVDVSHTGKTAATLGVDVYYCGSSVSFGGWRGTSYFTNGHADHLELRLTAYTSGATVSSGGSVSPSPTNALAHTSVVNTTKKYIRLYNSVPNATGTMNLTVGKWKLEKGNTATDWTPAPEDMAVGGRNLLAKTKELTQGVWVYDGATRGDDVALIATSDKRIYQLPSVGYWTWTTGTSYAVSVDARADASTVLEIDAYGASSSGMSKQFTVGTSWERYAFVFTATNVNTGSLSFYRKGSASTTLYLRRPKLEVGTTATDWTPAPEDVDSAISDAAKTATSYVTDINSNGITVHPSRSDYATNGGRAVINADGLTVYLGSDDVASYGASARIGKANSDRVTVDSTDGITIYKGNSKRLQTTANGIDVYGSDGTTSIASFGATARLGSTSSGNYMTLDSSGMEIHNAANFGAKIAYDLVSLLSGSFTMQSEVEQSSGHSMESWVRHCSYIRHKFYSSATSPSINLYDQKTTSAETGTDSYSSGIMLNGDVKCMDGRITVVGGANGALIATDAGSVGISGDGTWVIRRDVNYGLVLGSGAADHLYARESTVTTNTTNATQSGDNHCWNNGAVCSFVYRCAVKSALANGSELAVGTLPANYRPPYDMAVEVYTSTAARANAKVGTNGTITVKNVSGSSLATSVLLRISGTWAL